MLFIQCASTSPAVPHVSPGLLTQDSQWPQTIPIKADTLSADFLVINSSLTHYQIAFLDPTKENKDFWQGLICLGAPFYYENCQ